jgi:hypothetical protein
VITGKKILVLPLVENAVQASVCHHHALLLLKAPCLSTRAIRFIDQRLTHYTGAAGFLVGGTAGILGSPTPFLFATFSGLQWFVLGSTFWGTRSTILQAWTPEYRTPSNLIQASTLSGGITGGVVGLLIRGRRNVLPGMLMFSLAGFTGQWAHNAFDSSRIKRESGDVQPTKSLSERMSGKGWSLMKVMSDEEYKELLKKQQLVVDAEIAVLEDKITALRRQQQEEQGMEDSKPTSSQG